MLQFIEKISSKKANAIQLNRSLLFKYQHGLQEDMLYKDYSTDEVCILTRWMRDSSYSLYEGNKEHSEYIIEVFFKDMAKVAGICKNVYLESEKAAV